MCSPLKPSSLSTWLLFCFTCFKVNYHAFFLSPLKLFGFRKLFRSHPTTTSSASTISYISRKFVNVSLPRMRPESLRTKWSEQIPFHLIWSLSLVSWYRISLSRLKYFMKAFGFHPAYNMRVKWGNVWEFLANMKQLANLCGPLNVSCSHGSQEFLPFILYLNIWVLSFSKLCMSSEAVESPDHLMPSIIRVNHKKGESAQEYQCSRLPRSESNCHSSETQSCHASNEVTPVSAFFVLEVSFFFFFFFCHTQAVQKFPGQGSNPSSGSDNAESLTTRPPGNSCSWGFHHHVTRWYFTHLIYIILTWIPRWFSPLPNLSGLQVVLIATHLRTSTVV